MFSARWIRENGPAFDAGLARRGVEPHAHRVIALDARRREVQTTFQERQKARNRISKEIGAARGRGEDASELVARVGALKDEAQALDREEKALAADLDELLVGLPNLPADDVPEGADESANVEIRRWGELALADGSAKQHFEIGEALGLMDFERAAKLSGSRFVVLSGALARLERALAAFMLDMHTNEFGYTETVPPLLVRDDAAFGTGNLPKFEEDLFHTTDGYWLIPTAEMPLTNLVSGDILEEDALPLRFTAYTPCFRAEAGAAGKDTRGMLRQHQFSKVELVSVTRPEDSEAEHERMTALRRRGVEAPRPRIPGGRAVRRRHGLLGAQDLRHRGLAAGAGALPRNLQLLQLLGLPGAAHERALPACRREADQLRPHPSTALRWRWAALSSPCLKTISARTAAWPCPRRSAPTWAA